jgi:hypothetical protein
LPRIPPTCVFTVDSLANPRPAISGGRQAPGHGGEDLTLLVRQGQEGGWGRVGAA